MKLYYSKLLVNDLRERLTKTTDLTESGRTARKAIQTEIKFLDAIIKDLEALVI